MVSSIGTVFLPSFVKISWNGVHTDSAVMLKPQDGK